MNFNTNKNENSESELTQSVGLSFRSDLLGDDEGVKIIDMTSLRNRILIERSTSLLCIDEHPSTDDDKIKRLSLAYEHLRVMPRVMVLELAPFVKILDITNNEFDKLDFLSEFKQLTMLICDHNKITSETHIPYLPRLELLWLNHCKIKKLYPWVKKLQHSCPNLRYLSLMGNLAAPSYLNGGNVQDHLHYRYFVISIFPKLIHLDDQPITEQERMEVLKIYPKQIPDQLLLYLPINIPSYLRNVTERVTHILSSTPNSFVSLPRNAVI